MAVEAMETGHRDRVSIGLAQFLAGLTPEEREGLAGVLRDRRTFLAENMTDVLAILRQLEM